MYGKNVKSSYRFFEKLLEINQDIYIAILMMYCQGGKQDIGLLYYTDSKCEKFCKIDFNSKFTINQLCRLLDYHLFKIDIIDVDLMKTFDAVYEKGINKNVKIC